MSASKLAGSATESLIGNLISDLYSYLKGHLSEKIKLWHIGQKTQQIKLIKKHIHNIQRVKTLWQVDKSVDLNRFYCDSHIFLGAQRTKITSLKDLFPRKQIVITGIAGQGKSILLRYLCCNILRQGEYLPIFIELRRILSPDSLDKHIIRYFETIGISADEHLLKLLLASGKIVLLLDGFDEIQETEKTHIIDEIEHLGQTYDSLIIITSRPESGIERSSLFEIVKLDNLRGNEYIQVIKKLTFDKKLAETLIKQVELNKSNLQEVLCTPLLVTLLVMAYKSFQELPAQLSDFYDSIFQVLLQRHDGAKPGYKRPRRCNLNDNQYRTIFECMCYLSKKTNKSIFTHEELCKFAKEAFSLQQLGEQSDEFLTDIIRVTCLILKEGEDFRFIHKSVQEYYAASYIKHRTENNAIKFYSFFVDFSEDEVRRVAQWGQEMRFLSEIDQYRYSKYYLLPSLCRELKCEVDSIPDECLKYTADELRERLGKLYLILDLQSENTRLVGIGSHGHRNLDVLQKILTLDMSKVISMIKQGTIPIDEKEPWAGNERAIVQVLEIIKAGQLQAEFETMENDYLEKEYKKALRTRDIVKIEDSRELLPLIDIG